VEEGGGWVLGDMRGPELVFLGSIPGVGGRIKPLGYLFYQHVVRYGLKVSARPGVI